METEYEEETYSKVLYIIVGILALMILIFVLGLMTGQNIFGPIVCGLVWYIPMSGPDLAAYVGCGGIPL